MSDAPGLAADAALAELLEQCVLAFESEGEVAVERLLTAQPALAGIARERFAALRAAGILLAPSPVTPAPLPETIGPYRVLALLGDGGMGRVYLAEQASPLRRRVALKVVRRGLDTQDVLARFELERRALALLEHPHIAKIFDAGSTESGQPFFAMEHVAGTPITRYCAEHGFSARQRLALFAQVCDAVQHAHQRGILHRDLKPSNILVAEREGQPWPMLIDFGFAKALEPQPDLGNMHTERGRVLGTPEYMSPEQAAYRQDLDTRSDVFSLGVVLYELVTGVLPIASARLRQASPSELERILREEIPPRPSLSVPRLHGDVDWIVMRTLEKDRDRRYAMAADLGADLRRYLAGDAVLAGPPSGWYRLSRLARKYRTMVAGAAALVATLLAGLIVSVTYAASAGRAEVRASNALASAERSLAKALEAADELLIRVGGEGMRAFPEMAATRRALLESGLRFCESLLAGESPGRLADLRRAEVHLRVANFLDELARREDAVRTLDAALLLTGAASGYGPRDADSLVMAVALHTKRANILDLQEGAEKLLAARDAALAAARELVVREPGERAERTLAETTVWRTHSLLAAEREGPEVKSAIADALDCVRRIDALAVAPDPQLARMLLCMPRIAKTFLVRGDATAAEKVLAETEDVLVRLRRAAPEDPELLHILAPMIANKGQVRRHLGQTDRASEDLAQAEGIYQELRQRSPGDVRPIAGLAGVHREQGMMLGNRVQYQQAIAKLQAAVAEEEQVIRARGEDSSAVVDLAVVLSHLAEMVAAYNDLDPAVPLEPALSAARRGSEILQRMSDRARATPQALGARLLVCTTAGRLLLGAAQPAPAREVLQDAATAGRALVAMSAAHLGHRLHLGRALRLEAEAACDEGEFLAARVSIAESIEHLEIAYAGGPPLGGRSDEPGLGHLCSCRVELALGQVEAFEQALARAEQAMPARSGTLRDTARALLLAARSAPAALRSLGLSCGLERAAQALAALEAEVPDPGTREQPMYLVPRARIREVEAQLHELAGDAAAARLAWEGTLECHERVFALGRGMPRDRERLRQAFDGLLGCLRAVGTPQQVAAVEARRERLLGQ